jgi:hypothetical protein
MERNHQVSLMKEIYQNCEQVIIWMGESQPPNGLEVSTTCSTNIITKLKFWTNMDADKAMVDSYWNDFDGDVETTHPRLH